MKGGPPPPGPKGLAPKSAAPALPVRPAMTPVRWTTIPPAQVEKTIFRMLNPGAAPVELNLDLLQETFLMEGRDEAKEGDKDKKEDGAADKPQPRVLSQQRLQTVEIIMKRLTVPIDDIRRGLLAADKAVLQPGVLSELLGLFPIKSYEEERAQFAAFTGDPKTLYKPERFFHEMISIPRIREVLSALVFTQEAGVRVTELQANGKLLQNALNELKSAKMLAILEVCLAAGNYLNSGGKNPKAPAPGFRVGSLLKMNEVVARTSKTSLLAFIVRELEGSNPKLLEVFDELPSLSAAANGA